MGNDHKSESPERIVKMCGISLEKAKSEIGDLIAQENPVVTCKEINGEVHVMILARDAEGKPAEKIAKQTVKELKSRFGMYIYSTEGKETLEESIVNLLITNGLTLSTVESCTGGMVAARIINASGASEVYKEGFITYSNKAKRNRVGVKKSTLKSNGAVSSQTAKEMSKGGCKYAETDACVATTGIAGPLGGTDEKPVGLVYISCTVCGTTEVIECHFDGDRQEIRTRATAEALSLLRICVLKYYSEKMFS